MNTNIPINMTTYIQNYKLHTVNNVPLKISFELHNIPLPLANSLRRSCSSRIPTVAFDDTWDDDIDLRSIIINKNTSGLHNEFLSHRLGLLPLNMNHESLKISTEFNKSSSHRTYSFINDYIPIFSLIKKNNIESKPYLDELGMLNVTTLDFTINNASFPITDFFIADPYIDNKEDAYVIIDKLKSNFNNEDDGEELDLICKPTIGIGWTNARYDPTGTVTFGFKTDESSVDDIFKKKMEYMNNERLNKNLEVYSEVEEKQLRTSFNLLDKERVFKRDQYGYPEIIEMSIETIGFMKPTQILLSGLHILKLLLCDIKNSIDIELVSNEVKLNNISKINYIKSPIYENGWTIRLFDEDHTLGNLIGKYARTLFNKSEDDLMKYISYKMDHPLINNVDIVLVPHLNRAKYSEWLSKNYFETGNNKTFNDLGINMNIINEMSDDIFYKFISTIVLLNTINNILSDINKLISESMELTKEIDPIFIINDNENYINKYGDL